MPKIKDKTEPSAASDQAKSKESVSSKDHHWPFLAMAVLFGFAGGLFTQFIVDDQPQSSITQQESIILQEGEVIANVAERVGPSVVSIAAEGQQTFSFFSTNNNASRGTGIIISEDGYVVTNKHVIPDNVTDLSITTSEGVEYQDVELIDRDPFNDIAYLKINTEDTLTPAKLGDSSEVRVGQKVIAIGNALGRFSNTVTSGIISGQGRPILAGGQSGQDISSLTNLLQTDAAINPGNSGGPLVNLRGEVIAINTAVAGNAENIGFAIPISDVEAGIVSVQETGELRIPYLGVRYVAVTEDVADRYNLDANDGAYVLEDVDEPVLDGSPAQEAGIEPGDVITEINGQQVNQDNQLAQVIGRLEVGDKVNINVNRDGDTVELTATLEVAPNL